MSGIFQHFTTCSTTTPPVCSKHAEQMVLETYPVVVNYPVHIGWFCQSCEGETQPLPSAVQGDVHWLDWHEEER